MTKGITFSWTKKLLSNLKTNVFTIIFVLDDDYDH